MKQLKSTAEDLREVFDSAITVRHIAEPLASFDHTRTAETVRAFMDEKDFDRIGVRRDGQICGYALREELRQGCLGDHLRPIEELPTLAETAPISRALDKLGSGAILVTVLGRPGGIITLGDLQKAPVRMWLFGLITLLEMQMLRVIKLRYPDETWAELLSEGRRAKATGLFREHRGKDLGLECVDYLQFCDKRCIVVKTEDLWPRLALESKVSGTRFLEDLEGLRDDLAHAQHFLLGRGLPELLDLVEQTERTLQAAEQLSGTEFQGAGSA